MSIGTLQLQSCLQRIYIEKKRNIRITCCECFSHLILIVILVLGYQQSIILYYDSYIYSEIKITIPPITGINNLNNQLSTSSAFNTGNQIYDLYQQYIQGPLLIPTLDQYLIVSNLISDNYENLGSVGNIISQTSIGN